MIRCFIGMDRAETVAFHVLAHSIVKRSSKPVMVTGLVLSQLPMWRDRDPKQSTDFAFSRFLVPYLCDYKGRAIFMDCDMLCRGDIAELWDAPWPNSVLSVVKHEYEPKGSDKFLGRRQTQYEKKNWSSVMVFNNEHCRMLTPEYVNSATGLELHQFKWLGGAQIQALPKEWNHLVGEYEPNPKAKLVHFTLGTPCFAKYRNCEFAREWYEEKAAMLDYDRRGEFNKEDRQEAISLT